MCFLLEIFKYFLRFGRDRFGLLAIRLGRKETAVHYLSLVKFRTRCGINHTQRWPLDERLTRHQPRNLAIPPADTASLCPVGQQSVHTHLTHTCRGLDFPSQPTLWRGE